MLVCLIFKDLLLERAVGMSEVCVELVGKLVGEMLGLGVRTVTWTAAYAASPNRLLRLSIVS